MIQAIADSTKVTKELQKFINGIDDWSRPVKKSLQILREEQKENFVKQGAIYQGGGFVRPGGAFANNGRATTRSGPWEPLKESTKKQRKRLGYRPSRPILERTGKLKNGFRISKVSKKEGVIENTVEYGKFHQEGTSKMVARKIIGSSNKSRAAIKIEFLKYIQGNIKRFNKGI